MEILLREIRESADLKLQANLSEDDFKEKFPFNLVEEKKEEPPKPTPVQPKKEEKKVEP